MSIVVPLECGGTAAALPVMGSAVTFGAVPRARHRHGSTKHATHGSSRNAGPQFW